MGKHGYCHLKKSLFDFYAYYRPNILSQCGDLVYKLLGAHVVFRSYLDNYAASNLERHAAGFQICLFHSFVKENFVKTRQIMEIEVNFDFGKMCANKQQEYTLEYLCRIGIILYDIIEYSAAVPRLYNMSEMEL